MNVLKMNSVKIVNSRKEIINFLEKLMEQNYLKIEVTSAEAYVIYP
jgi:hypothetical protein